ncbi:hypothetical protein PUNSTDRAFT_55316 [Punctularia strigosozonata HHB-11173 SS5]|uniref:CENP-V/GFA domain-containing protein n=1 Tax=Punctularia strigosozonata (strain HHB-11173) TaxID=741275 RepID=R7S5T7_PUNST|nr:uncharacterized protein PUNSTDRAFT_55316 [Punctularia strigosozonata HHB-11173 SS5]EIN05036.1 hypothetical protein PUNSTDRAFT_55316 [Punctularia strigosozonata HHB-11173 SS5]
MVGPLGPVQKHVTGIKSRDQTCLIPKPLGYILMASATADKTEPYFPLAGVASDGWSNDDEATATCFCGAVQLAFPTSGPGLVGTFVCHCTDCRKITASMFATNFTIDDAYLKHLRGRENLSSWGQSKTIKRGTKMTNYFCKTCGTLMYRVGEAFPGKSILRVGTVDDFSLHETKLKPKREFFVKDKVGWLTSCVDGAVQFETMPGM